jgi:hypothetical protein
MMKRKRHSPEQIIRRLRDADRMLSDGRDIAAVCQSLEGSEATFHHWRNQYGGSNPLARYPIAGIGTYGSFLSVSESCVRFGTLVFRLESGTRTSGPTLWTTSQTDPITTATATTCARCRSSRSPVGQLTSVTQGRVAVIMQCWSALRDGRVSPSRPPTARTISAVWK